jgi:DNA polymerase-3 subunit alpha
MGKSQETQFEIPPVVEQPSSRHQLLLREKELLGFFLSGHPMDEYRVMMQKLSCIPLAEGLNLDHDAIFRTAFLIEEAEARLATKTQKKFAILTISDGDENHELPIWSDLYDQVNPLLKDNQLLYAVLQVDRREENVRFNCRWIGDLTQANEEMIQACDLAFDQAKQAVVRRQNFNSNRKKEPSMASASSSSAPQTVPQSVTVKVDIDRLKLSEVLQIKEIARAFPGKEPLIIDFHSEKRVVGRIVVENPWGVTLTPDLKKKLEELSCVTGLDSGNSS